MTITTLPDRRPTTPHDLGDVRPAVRRFVEVLGDLWHAVWTTLWAAASYERVLTARLIAWFAAEAHRIQAAVAGIVICVLTGIAVGALIGALAVRVAYVLLSFVQNP